MEIVICKLRDKYEDLTKIVLDDCFIFSKLFIIQYPSRLPSERAETFSRSRLVASLYLKADEPRSFIDLN